MLLRSFLILLPCLFAFANAKTKVEIVGEKRLTESTYPENFKKLKTLYEFTKIVNEHKMNVSLILSSGTNYKKGNLKEVMAMTLTFPVNSEPLKETHLTPEVFTPLLDAALKEKIAIRGTAAQSNELHVYTNYPEGLPINKAFKIFSGIKNGKTGFVFDEQNYGAQYTYISPGQDGKNQTTKVFYGDIDVEVLHQENLKENEIEVIKKALVDIYFTSEEEPFARALFARLNKDLPQYNWEVAGDVGEHNYVQATSWAQLKILGENYLVYSI